MNHSISICIATRNHAPLLRRTLDSIFQQLPIRHVRVEVIVADDGSDDDTAAMLKGYCVRYFRLENSTYRNGVFAKNTAMRAATGDIIIQQSDDVIHASPNLIRDLVDDFQPGTFKICTIYDFDTATGEMNSLKTGSKNPRPLFWLGASWREDVCKVGGYDPELGSVLWYDDDWHANGLVRGLQLTPEYVPLLGLHQSHERPEYDPTPAQYIYESKRLAAIFDGGSWLSSSGPWPFVQGKSVNEVERHAA